MISEKIKQLRLNAGLTQLELGNKLGYKDGAMISQWEVGYASPNLSSVKKLCEHFKVSADWLLGIDD